MTARYFILDDGSLQEASQQAPLNPLGVGVFETFLVEIVESPKAIEFSGHIERLNAGAKVLGLLVPDLNVLRRSIKEAVLSLGLDSSECFKIRIVVTDSCCALAVEPFKRPVYTTGISLMSFCGTRVLPEIKSCSALLSWWSARAAVSKGFDEALLVDSDGIMREGSWSNIFWFENNGGFHTTASKILPGVTRGKILDLPAQQINCTAKDITYSEFIQVVDEAFITSALRGVVPVTRIDGKILNEGFPGERTLKVSSAYLNGLKCEAL